MIKKAIIFLMMFIFVLPVVAGENEETIKNRDYNLVMIWIKDQAKWDQYLKESADVVSKYGGGIERSIEPTFIYSVDGMEKPDVVNIAYWDNRETGMKFYGDPEFQKLIPLRNEAAKIIGINAQVLNFADVDNRGVDNRQYNIELAYFKEDADLGKYEHVYKKPAADHFGKYGFNFERSMKGNQAFGMQTPDLINIQFYENEEGAKKAHEDPKHHDFSHNKYASVVEKSIWISGKVAK